MRRGLFLVLILLIFSPHPAAAAERWGPWDEPDRQGTSTTADTAGSLHLLRAGVRFFQSFISPVDGPRCPMYPTCSAFALQALEKHGPLIGSMMTVDRLFHETDPREHRHPVAVGGRIRFADPVANNDFWFARR